jgi:hypothetical protein
MNVNSLLQRAVKNPQKNLFNSKIVKLAAVHTAIYQKSIGFFKVWFSKSDAVQLFFSF